ncbi:integrase [Burkholderia sp. WAC0059]|uniref:Mu transposase C-terminal domain-containing protein n=1 Tax=Burkholderia sp. WAC0059 TaxID=2066022 RepID=UPI000C7F1B4B|nr:Mu transposase C-terminal domain-containing protein [Burkholderia sp. WAC0059]PLZ00963.1 integrase [Burkholderia sp. WAC0059]
MLDKAALTDLFDRLGTPPNGRQLVMRARINAPVRDIYSKGGAVRTIMYSRKMGCEIATSSYRVEYPAAVRHEFDAGVLEYFPQPCKEVIELVDEATGEIREIEHTPDFLVIRADGFTLEEWKTENMLARLVEKKPWRYTREADGTWRAPGVEKHFADLGIHYRIFTGESHPRVYVANLEYLAEYLLPEAEACPVEVLSRLNAALREHGALSFHELLHAPHGFTADQLNKAIADHLVVTALDRQPLTDNKRLFHLYRDASLRDFLLADQRSDIAAGTERFTFEIAEGTKFEYEGQVLRIDLLGENKVVCTKPDGSNIELEHDWLIEAHTTQRIRIVEPGSTSLLNLSHYTGQELEIALQRQAAVESGSGFSERTLRRLRARQALAHAYGTDDVLALVPDIRQRGNRAARLSEIQLVLIQRVIDEFWRTNKAPNYKACYRFYVALSNESEAKAVSYPTLIHYIKAQATVHDVRIRHGQREAYQQGPFVDALHYDTHVHGTRPFQYVHIDHTTLDIELVSSTTGRNLGKPTLSIAIDAWSRRILGFYLSFDPPSYVACMMAIRDIVRRFQRMPECIVTDNGPDFDSKAFAQLLRVMRCATRFRPAGRPRHGAVLERVFGHANTEYIHNLAGNTKAMKNPRRVSSSHDPKKQAEWTLPALYRGLEHWATEYYDESRHPALGESPREAFVRGLRENGGRGHTQVLFNQDFLTATCPPVKRGPRKVDGQRGVKVNELMYRHPSLEKYDGQHLDVRFDPWDASSVYVRLKDGWVRAVCPALNGLGQYTERERAAMGEEYLRRNRTPVDEAREAQRLREFMQTFTPEGALAVACECQAENKLLYNSLDMASITPVSGLRRSFSLNEGNTRPASTPAGSGTTTTTTTEQSRPVNEAPAEDTFNIPLEWNSR